jgi:hypothetical protein
MTQRGTYTRRRLLEKAGAAGAVAGGTLWAPGSDRRPTRASGTGLAPAQTADEPEPSV